MAKRKKSESCIGGLNRPSGAGVTVKLGGRTLILRPLGLKDLGLIESEILAKRPNPLRVVAELKDELSQDEYDRLMTKAYEDAIQAGKATDKEITTYMDSPEGVAFSTWLSVIKEDDTITLEWIEKILFTFDEKQLDDIQGMVEKASGLDELGNSTGLTAGRNEVKDSQNGVSESAINPEAGLSLPGEVITET